MIIHLHEIPKEGKNWSYDQNHAEARTLFNDLLGANPFLIQVHIEPLGASGTFQMSGVFTGQWPEDCSRCGDDFKYDSRQKFSHLLMPKFPAARDEKTAKTNHLSDNLSVGLTDDLGMEVFEYQGNTLNVGQFLHEIVALAKPLIPAPSVDCHGQCELCKIPVHQQSFSYDEPMETKQSPFAGLGQIKIN